MTLKKAALAALLVLAACAPTASIEPTQGQPTPLVIYVTPTPEPTATPAPTIDAELSMAYLAWLDETLAVLDAQEPLLDAFWDSEARSAEELTAAQSIAQLWVDEQAWIASHSPRDCYAEGYALWSSLTNQQASLWGTAAAVRAAGGSIDYDGLNDTSRMTAMTAWFNSEELCD